jgi:putative ABC transport system permease protein
MLPVYDEFLGPITETQMFGMLMRDVKFAFRSLRKRPGFASVAILTVGLGISINTAVFSAVYAILVNPLPYPQSDRLVRVWPSMPSRGVDRASTSLVNYQDLRSKNTSLDALGAYYSLDFSLTDQTEPQRLRAVATTASFFQVLGVNPIAGTTYDANAELWGRHRVAVLSEQLWKSHFGGDRSVIGHTISLDDQSYQIIGIMPGSFTFPDDSTRIWVPISFPPGDPMAGGDHYFLDMVGRAKAGITLDQLRSQLGSLLQRINPDLGGVTVQNLKDFIVGNTRLTLLLLTGTVALVLLVACTNIANLLLVRATSRRREISVRVAVGAGQWHIVQQTLIESLLLSLSGGVLGLFLAAFFVKVMKTWTLAGIPRLQDVSIDLGVLFFTLGLAIVTGLIFGIPPAWRAARVKAAEALKESRGGGDVRRTRRQGMLIVGEISLSLALLICAGLLVVSIVHLQRTDPGFHADHATTLQLNLSKIRYPDSQRVSNFLDDMTRNLRALPGIQGAGATSLLPFAPGDFNTLFSAEGQTPPHSFADVPVVRFVQVTPDYFHAIGATLKSGRYFTDEDRLKHPRVAIVNEALVRRFWKNDNEALGKKVHPGPPESLIGLPPGAIPSMDVVGIVENWHQEGLDTDFKPTMFVPFAQVMGESQLSLFVVVRSNENRPELPTTIANSIHSIDPALPISDIQTMERRVRDSFMRQSITMWLLCIFAGAALLIAVVGVYGFISYSVTQRTQEVGLRMALGATASNVLQLVLRECAKLTALGIILGSILGFILAQLSKGLLFGVRPVNPLVYGIMAVILFSMALLGAYIPARRASRLDPMNALRYE